jgi:hypothetical protein
MNVNDFDAELRLLGLYEQEVIKTGFFDYPAQWSRPKPTAMEKASTPESLPQPSPQAPDKPTSAVIPEPLDLPPIPDVPAPFSDNIPAIDPPLQNAQAIFNADELPVSISLQDGDTPVPIPDSSEAFQQASFVFERPDLSPDELPVSISLQDGDTPVPRIDPFEARRQTLLKEQEMERRLLSLFAEEVEHIDDLCQLPAFLRSALLTKAS